jgi:SAM-dependent methyltransferase
MYHCLRKKIENTVRERFHNKRANLFLSLMKPKDGVSILDMGGGTGDFLARIQKRVKGKFIVAEIEDFFSPSVKKYGFEFILIKEGEPLPFRDKEFDIVISNSVIEHVTLPKVACMTKMQQSKWLYESFQSQKNYANEIHRIGKSWFVQTPHKNFPIEMHTWLPFVNFLNHNKTISLVKMTDKFWIKKCGYVDWNLLGNNEMKELFPEANILIEHLWGLPKSTIAYYLGDCKSV